MRVAVYTSITGGYDSLKEEQNFAGGDFIAFTDAAARDTRWEVRRPHVAFADPNRNAKIHKVLAHRYLPDYDCSLWIDGTMRLVAPVRDLVDRYLAESDIALFRHHARDCAYVEADVCAERGLDDAGVIRAQMARYEAAGYPRRNGLYAATVILRRHTPRVEALNELWWQEICSGSRRDQLSLGFALWRLGVSPAALPETVYSVPDMFIWKRRRGRRPSRLERLAALLRRF